MILYALKCIRFVVMPGLTEDESGCMILYALKCIRFVVMPGLTEDESGCMILYALKCIRFVVMPGLNGRRVGLHDFVCTEVYSVCCHAWT